MKIRIYICISIYGEREREKKKRTNNSTKIQPGIMSVEIAKKESYPLYKRGDILFTLLI